MVSSESIPLRSIRFSPGCFYRLGCGTCLKHPRFRSSEASLRGTIRTCPPDTKNRKCLSGKDLGNNSLQYPQAESRWLVGFVVACLTIGVMTGIEWHVAGLENYLPAKTHFLCVQNRMPIIISNRGLPKKLPSIVGSQSNWPFERFPATWLRDFCHISIENFLK